MSWIASLVKYSVPMDFYVKDDVEGEGCETLFTLHISFNTAFLIAWRSISFIEQGIWKPVDDYFSIPPLNVYWHSALGELFCLETVFIMDPTNDIRFEPPFPLLMYEVNNDFIASPKPKNVNHPCKYNCLSTV